MSDFKIFYRVPAPYTLDGWIEVYGDGHQGWYEYRLIQAGKIVKDTGTEGHHAFQGRQYGQPEIALRDALMFTSGMMLEAS